MILPVLKYGHPVLRQKGARIESITAEIHELIADMQDTMYAAKGVGLAAQQVGRALQLAVIDVSGVKDRPSTLKLHGLPAEVEDYMPIVLINPQVKPIGELIAGAEGCLSFPEIYGEVIRPESVDVTALNEKGKKMQFECGGLLARAIQHEVDHLNGILFIDRMSLEKKQELKPETDELQMSTKEALKKKLKS
jgi:peptide deformylase